MRIVIAAAAQTVSHWKPEYGADTAPSPTILRAEAARRVLPSHLKHVGALAVVRTTDDSLPTSTHPFGRDANPPGTLARALGLEADELIHSGSGGQSPGALLLEMAERIHAGRITSALIVSAEATGAAKLARRTGLTLSWAADDPAPLTDRGAALDWMDPHELRHGLHTPAHYYALVETALAHRDGHGREAHRRAMAELLAPFSEVAAANPHSQFPVAWSADALATPSPENYPLADPYLKHHAAQDAVNQGVAVLVMRESEALEMGLSEFTYLLGGATAKDGTLSRRGDITRAGAMEAAGRAALEATGVELADVDALDLYSCFPCAVWCGLAALGHSAPIPVPLTVTGGLPFFGGPGNGYSLHALAEMHTRLRSTRERGLVLANGGWLSKAAVTLHSGAPADYTPAPPRIDAAQDERDLVTTSCEGRLEAFTFTRDRNSVPVLGTALVRVRDSRALATATGDALTVLAEDRSPIGRDVRVEVENGIGRLHFLGGIR